jgi:hypothetical protein
VIACPVCGGDRIEAHDAPYDEPGIMSATCQRCHKSFDVRVTASGVEPAPVIYHGPESGFAPYSHREWEPCVLCDLADAADAADPDPNPDRAGRDFQGAFDNPPRVPSIYHPELGYWHDAQAPCALCGDPGRTG